MRLIDAEAYGEEMRERQTACIKWHEEVISSGDEVMIAWVGGARSVFSEAKLTLEKMPTIDAVEVVRCKECQWRDKKTANCERFRKGWYVQANSFCSLGERRTDE